MTDLEKYLALMKQHPHLFHNPPDASIIRIVSDRDLIEEEQSRLRESLRKGGKPEEWIDIGLLVEDPWFLVIRDLVKFPNGRYGGYIRFVNRKSLEGGFGVVLLTIQEGKILLLRHFRHDDRSWHWEFPRGFGEPGLSAEDNARKELEEEVGAFRVRLTRLGEETVGKGGTTFFFAELPPGETISPVVDEGINSIRWLALPDLETWIAEGRVGDIFSLKAYLLAKLRGKI